MNRTKHHYIGKNDCKVATCTLKQEFPDGDDPYCIVHSLSRFVKEKQTKSYRGGCHE